MGEGVPSAAAYSRAADHDKLRRRDAVEPVTLLCRGRAPCKMGQTWTSCCPGSRRMRAGPREADTQAACSAVRLQSGRVAQGEPFTRPSQLGAACRHMAKDTEEVIPRCCRAGRRHCQRSSARTTGPVTQPHPNAVESAHKRHSPNHSTRGCSGLLGLLCLSICGEHRCRHASAVTDLVAVLARPGPYLGIADGGTLARGSRAAARGGGAPTASASRSATATPVGTRCRGRSVLPGLCRVRRSRGEADVVERADDAKDAVQRLLGIDGELQRGLQV